MLIFLFDNYTARFIEEKYLNNIYVCVCGNYSKLKMQYSVNVRKAFHNKVIMGDSKIKFHVGRGPMEIF